MPSPSSEAHRNSRICLSPCETARQARRVPIVARKLSVRRHVAGRLVGWSAGRLVGWWLSGFLAFWLSGFLALWLSGSLAPWLPGSLAFLLSGFLAFRFVASGCACVSNSHYQQAGNAWHRASGLCSRFTLNLTRRGRLTSTRQKSRRIEFAAPKPCTPLQPKPNPPPLRTLLRSLGQIVLQPNAFTGACLLAAWLLCDPRLACAALMGAIAANVSAGVGRVSRGRHACRPARL